MPGSENDKRGVNSAMPKVAINGFGRMGRLALRAAWHWQDFDIVQVNEVAGDAHTAAHLVTFDSIHGRWDTPVSAADDALLIDGTRVGYSRNAAIEDTPWRDQVGADIVLDCTGKFRNPDALQRYLDAGVPKVVVSAPVKAGALNIVMGVNHERYDPARHDIVTAASCTTNCIAPVIAVLHERGGIRHGTITTIHDITNTQNVLDGFHKDLRRARASGESLIPTSTGSASAIGDIFPELDGRLSGLAVRVPIANASLTDCVFELDAPTTADTVNQWLTDAASQPPLAGILGVETRPLVSVDFRGDTRSAIVDAPSTLVTNGTQVKLFVWYDNEIGYVHRMMELVATVARNL